MNTRSPVTSWLWLLVVLPGVVLIGLRFLNKDILKLKTPGENKSRVDTVLTTERNYDQFIYFAAQPNQMYKITFDEPGKSGEVDLRYVGHFRIESDSGHYSWYSEVEEVIYEPPRHERDSNRVTNLNLNRENARLFIESRSKKNEVTIKTWKSSF
jgi:hypothetical protein